MRIKQNHVFVDPSLICDFGKIFLNALIVNQMLLTVVEYLIRLFQAFALMAVVAPRLFSW